jgi:hypothetical protein
VINELFTRAMNEYFLISEISAQSELLGGDKTQSDQNDKEISSR